MNKVRVSAISYLNTYPFLYGIYSNPELLEMIDLTIDYPSACAKKLENDEVDVGLIPVASFLKIKNARVISDYCISSDKQVKSVMLFSDVNVYQVKNILLDYQSVTSVNLTKLLAEKYWKISPIWLDTKDEYEKNINNNTAGVVIGDRALNLLDKYQFNYDLAEEWFKFTDFPFVFATWTANKKLPDYFIKVFNNALKFGVENIEKTLDYFKEKISLINYNPKIYLTENISYNLTYPKRQAIDIFTKYLMEM